MKPLTLTLSHPYKEMRERTEKQAEGKTTLLGVGWFFPHCHWTEAFVRLVSEQRHPEDLTAFRVMCIARNLAASAVAVTAVIMTPVAIVTVAVVPLVPRSDVNHPRRAIGHWRRTVNDAWRTIRHGRRIAWCCNHDLRCEANRSGKRDAHGPTRLRRGGEPSDCGDRNQTEDRFHFHARFDGEFTERFRGRKRRDVFRFKAVREKGSKNE